MDRTEVLQGLCLAGQTWQRSVGLAAKVGPVSRPSTLQMTHFPGADSDAVMHRVRPGRRDARVVMGDGAATGKC